MMRSRAKFILRLPLSRGITARGQESALQQTTVMILAGGQGERLYPLTKDRAKPAVPFGGSYRIIDFALSNCINSGLRRIFSSDPI